MNYIGGMSNAPLKSKKIKVKAKRMYFFMAIMNIARGMLI